MSDIIATVNGQPLSRRDLDDAIQGYALQHYRRPMDRLSVDEYRQAAALALEKLLGRSLIFLAALASGVVAGAAEVEAEQERLIANFPSAEEFFATLGKAGIGPAEHFRMLRQDLTVNRFSTEQLEPIAEPDEAALAAVWQQRQGDMRRPPRVRVAHLLVRDPGGGSVQARDRCAALAAEANGENFAALARQYSACPSSASGGDLGWRRPGELDPAFDALAFALPVGEIGGPVATPFGWHLVLVLEREESRPFTEAEALPLLRRQLVEQERARRLQQWVRELADQAEIHLLDTTLPWPAGLSRTA